MPEKYKATLEGIDLEIQDITDSFKKSIAKHDFPFLDGARLEDMGQTAHVIRFRCFFYEENYDMHEDVIQLLELQDLLELHHPKHGIIKGSIESLDIHHNSEFLKTAEVDIGFVEQLRGEVSLIENLTDIGPIIESTFINAKIEQMKELSTDVYGILGEDALEILNVELDPDLGFVDQFTSIVGKPRMFLNQIDSMIGTAKAALNTITNPIRSLLTTYDYLYNTGSHMLFNMSSYMMDVISDTVERYSLSHNSRKIAPVRFTESFIEDVKTFKDVTLPQTANHEMKQAAIDVFKKHVQIIMAQQAALDLGYIYAADEKVRQIQKRIEKNKSFDVLGRFQKPDTITPQVIGGTYDISSAPLGSATPEEYKVSSLITIDEIERALTNVRTEIQVSVEGARENIVLPVLPPSAVGEGISKIEPQIIEQMKELARQLFLHANEIKLEREKIMKVEVENESPLHLICLKYGLDYNAADRIHAINNIENPNFTKGNIGIYAR